MVQIFSSPTCAPCKQVKAYLRHKNINYDEYDVSTSKDAQKRLGELTGQSLVPTIVYGDTVIVGYNISMIAELARSLQPEPTKS